MIELTPFEFNIIMRMAFRYSLSRSSFASEMFTYIALNNLQHFNDETKILFSEEIGAEINSGLIKDPIDIEHWKNFLKDIK